MRIYLETASLDAAQWAADSGFADGLLTTPTLIGEANGDGDGRELILSLARSTAGSIGVSVESVNGTDIVRDGKELAKLADNIFVRVPFIEDAVVAVRRLTAEGVRVMADLVFTPAQAVLAAKAGAFAVATPMSEIDAFGYGALEAVRDIRLAFDAGRIECDVVALAPAHAAQFTQCTLARVDGVAVSPDVLRGLLQHPLTDRGFDRFLSALTRLPKPRATT
jgi:transaldolase